MKGNDSDYWIVTKTQNGVKRWIKYRNKNEKEKIYITQQNGASPYMVRITNHMINIYTFDDNNENDADCLKKSDYTKHV